MSISENEFQHIVARAHLQFAPESEEKEENR